MRQLTSQRQNSWLVWFLRGMLLLSIVVLLGRLAELQVIKGAYYRELAEGNRIRRVPISAPRGSIYARGGETLVSNGELKKEVGFDPIEGYEKIPATDQTPVDEVIIEWARKYDMASITGHITGYLGEVNEEEVSKVDARCPQNGVLIHGGMVGRSGLEEEYECLLRGVNGEELVEVDTRGRRVRLLGRKLPISGNDLHTTIDFKLQKKVAEVMDGKPGAVIITNTKGEILALYSSPSYDPNIFVTGEQKQVNEILINENLPLFNRVIGGVYHPGSIYKIVTSTAALEEGAIGSDFTYVDTGVVSVDSYNYTNWYFTEYGGVEGEIDLPRALSRSTDTFYYKLGEFTGIDALVVWSHRFGLGEKTGIDLPGEVNGLVPTPEWKKATKGERWYLGNTYHMAIGQGDLIITPLQSHRIVSVIAANGQLCTPFINAQKEENCAKLSISDTTLQLIEDGMTRACKPGGTGVPFFDFPINVACKTGTAETVEANVTHAWFVVYAPLDNPEIIMTVLVEKGGGGSDIAAPIAREVFDYVFNP